MGQSDRAFDTWSDATIARDIQKNLKPSSVASGKVSREQHQQEKQEPEEGVLKMTKTTMAMKILTKGSVQPFIMDVFRSYGRQFQTHEDATTW